MTPNDKYLCAKAMSASNEVDLVHECRVQERRRIAVNAYTSAHSTSLRTDTNSFGP